MFQRCSTRNGLRACTPKSGPLAWVLFPLPATPASNGPLLEGAIEPLGYLKHHSLVEEKLGVGSRKKHSWNPLCCATFLHCKQEAEEHLRMVMSHRHGTGLIAWVGPGLNQRGLCR